MYNGYSSCYIYVLELLSANLITPRTEMKLKNSVVIITGAFSGIGKETAMKLAG